MRNPFASSPLRLGLCAKEPDLCSYREDDAFPQVSNAPEVIPRGDAEGGAVLLMGEAGSGKTTFSHRLLHHYAREGLRSIDLMWDYGSIGHYKGLRQRVVTQLHDRTGGPRTGDLQPSMDDHGLWLEQMQNVLKDMDERIVVRLPPVRHARNGVEHSYIAEEIAQFAVAARWLKDIFIYEYAAPDIPGDWKRLKKELSKNGDIKVISYVIEPLTPGDLCRYIDSVFRKCQRPCVELDADVASALPNVLNWVFSQQIDAPPQIDYVHALMRESCDMAIEEGSPVVDTQYLFRALPRMGGGI